VVGGREGAGLKAVGGADGELEAGTAHLLTRNPHGDLVIRARLRPLRPALDREAAAGRVEVAVEVAGEARRLAEAAGVGRSGPVGVGRRTPRRRRGEEKGEAEPQRAEAE